MDRRTLPARFGGLVFLGVVFVTAALLIAGYGAPIGVGALVGIALGFLAGTVGTMWMSRGNAPYVAFNSTSHLGPGGHSAEDEMAWLREVSDLMSVDLGEVRRVVPVLSIVEAAGLRIQLVALELSDFGFSTIFDVTILPGSLRSPSMARVTIADDLGTSYRAVAQGEGSSSTRMRLRAVALPSPPDAAMRLTIAIPQLVDPFPSGSKALAGPWTFEVALR
jgi:hypothetical protein